MTVFGGGLDKRFFLLVVRDHRSDGLMRRSVSLYYVRRILTYSYHALGREECNEYSDNMIIHLSRIRDVAFSNCANLSFVIIDYLHCND
jgi:hypothetical protein